LKEGGTLGTTLSETPEALETPLGYIPPKLGDLPQEKGRSGEYIHRGLYTSIKKTFLVHKYRTLGSKTLMFQASKELPHQFSTKPGRGVI